jgi:predicted nuclease of restriction endonuclease-like (RecB) superfamily
MDFKQLIEDISQTNDYLQQKATAAVNQALTIRNWLFGLYIVEYEQNGQDRAQYGQNLLGAIAKELRETTATKDLSDRYLRYCRQFYQGYPQVGQILEEGALPTPIWKSLTSKLPAMKEVESQGVAARILLSRLSFTHIIELLKEEDPLKRAFYEIEAIRGNWSVRELKRQMGSLLYERTGLSKDKAKLLDMTHDKAVELFPKDIIRDPYIFEFLGLKQQEVMEESLLEKALLEDLESFLLELGKGFCFEARQKRITVDNEHYYVDLVFYHRLLKCHVLIDLKTGKFSYADAGQMNFYLNYYRDNETAAGDNPPIGIILCTDKSQSLVKYATTGMDSQLFISKYKVALPTEEELKRFIEEDRKRIE